MMEQTGKLLAVDVGDARIGVAVCDPLRLVARPLTVIHRRSRRQDFQRLAQIAAGEEVVALVCGLPLHMDGSEGDRSRQVRRWARRCAQALDTLLDKAPPIIFWDERLSTVAAQEILAATGLKVGEDAAAAAVILQSYLDACRRQPCDDSDRIDPSAPEASGDPGRSATNMP